MKKQLRCTLAVSLLLSSLIACGETAEETPKDTGNQTAGQTETEAVTEEVRQPYIEREDYGGATVMLQGFHVYYAPELYAEEENGDAYNDVIYQRILKTEEYLNIDLKFDDSIEIGDVAKTAETAVMSGADDIHLVLSHDMTGNSALVSRQLCYDMTTIESIDLTRDYWKYPSYEKLSVNGAVYLTKPAFIIPSVGCLTFNKEMMADYDITEPYEDVKNGTWTLDKFTEMCKIVTKDVNGDGVMDAQDIYGYVAGGDWDLNAFVYASDITVTSLDDDGKIVMSLDTPRTVELFDKMNTFLNDSGDFHQGDIGMQDNRCLFLQTTTKSLNYMRDCTVDFGVLPFPKWDDEQENYYGYDISAFVSILSSVSDPEMVGKTLEMLNYYSTEMVLPTYYDIQLYSKSVRDEESIEMLDLIFNSVICDAGRTYFGLDNNSLFNLVYSISHHVYKNHTNEFSSFYAKNIKGAEKCIEKFYTTVEKYQNP